MILSGSKPASGFCPQKICPVPLLESMTLWHLSFLTAL